ncbi:MAG TPA: PD-(D/E)XK nuclease superfamily protein [Polyangiaceae bacterium]
MLIPLPDTPAERAVEESTERPIEPTTERPIEPATERPIERPIERSAALNGHAYKRLIARYVVAEYGPRGVEVYDEVSAGTSMIGKQRRLDLLLLHRDSGRALALECKYQDTSGTADEKIPYALQDLATLRMPAAIVYAGAGFSMGVLHLLQSSEMAAYCLPGENMRRVARKKGEIDSGTWQLDHIVAMAFDFWDILIQGRAPLTLEDLGGR